MISGCTPTITSDKPVVMVSLFPQYDFVRAIAQDKVEVVLLLPPGVEPHAYEPTPATIIQIVEADLFIYTNELMEPWIAKIVENVKGDSLLLLDSSKGIGFIEHHHDHDEDAYHELLETFDHLHQEYEVETLTAQQVLNEMRLLMHAFLELEDTHDHDDHDDQKVSPTFVIEELHHILHEYFDDKIDAQSALNEISEVLALAYEIDDHDEADDHGHDSEDPHIWLDPQNAIIMVNNILEGLIQIDPSNESFYRNNAQAYIQELLTLDAAFVDLFEKAKTNTIIYGGHFAFGYLANRFNLTILSPYTGFSPDAEPTAQAIAQLIDTMKDLQIDTIYFEELVDPKTARVLSEQTGASMLLLHGAHNLTTEERASNLTFIEIMYENIEHLKTGLKYE